MSVHARRRATSALRRHLLLQGNFQSYAANPYSAHTSMWGVSDPNRDQLVASSSMTVYPNTFPNGTVFDWDVTPDPDIGGPNGYLHVDYGNYDWSPGAITPRQVYTITALDLDVTWTYSGNPSSGLLSECWLSPVSAASGEFPKSHEIAFFPRSSPDAVAWLGTLPMVGSYTDSTGVIWDVRQGVSGVDDVPYLVSYRPGYVDFQGVLPYKDFFAFLIGKGTITGSEWVNGVAFGVEPNSGVGSLSVTKYVPTYAGAARVPWTVTNLSAVAQSNTTALLTWTPAAGATSHEYRVNGGTWTAAGAGTQAVTGLAASTAYTFEVRGVNATGNGAPSNTAGATTLASAQPVAFRAAASGSAGGATNVSAVIPAATQPGDLIIAAHIADTAGTFTDMTAPAGWTQLGAGSSMTGPGDVRLWKKTVVAGDAGSTVSFPDSSGSDAALALIVLSGASTTATLAPTFGGSDTATDSHIAPSVTGVADGHLLVFVMVGASVGVTGSHTAPTGMTTRVNAVGGGGLWVMASAFTQALSAAGATGTKTAPFSGSQPYISASLVVPPA